MVVDCVDGCSLYSFASADDITIQMVYPSTGMGLRCCTCCGGRQEVGAVLLEGVGSAQCSHSKIPATLASCL